MIFVAAAVVAGFVVFVFVGLYNNLIVLKNQTRNAWSQIDVQLKRRHDLIPNLIEAVKGAMEYEQSTLSRIVEARNRAMSAQGVREKAQQENVLTEALGKLFALAENYPQLKANQNLLQLQQELSSTEDGISASRQFYNESATRFNTAQETFPGSLVSRMGGFMPAQLFVVDDASQRQAPRVDLKG